MMEFRRLAKAVAGNETATLEEVTRLLRGPIVLQKGSVDTICGFERDVGTCVTPGVTVRACGGVAAFT